jgi:ubiquinone/menaquinone biosynthesis C-methylase UbiE
LDHTTDPEQIAALWESNAEAWTRLSRAGHDVYRDELNTPAMLDMLPSIVQLKGLDIGCGEGTNTRHLAARGARMHAIDVAPTFIRHCRETEAESPLGIDYQVSDAMHLPFLDETFDFATAFMSLMDMPNQELVLREAQRVLRPHGFFQFSILHPCFVPPHRKVLREDDGSVRAIEVANYFDRTDGRIETWCFSHASLEEQKQFAPFQIPRFHRTLSDWVEMINQAGLVIQEMGEPSATPEAIARFPMLRDTKVAGIFLHIRTVKP